MDDARFATSSRPGQRRRTRARATLGIAFLVVGLLAPTAVVRAAGNPQTITFDPAPTGVTVGATGKAVSATASSGLPVTYSSTTTGICTVDPSSGSLTLLAAGTCTIAADQTGDGTYDAAPQATQDVTVGLNSQTITFDLSGLPTKAYGDAPFAVSATASSNLAVTFSTTTTAVCTVTAGGTVTIVGAGSCTIQADQGGDTTFAAAPTVPRTFTVAKATLTVTADPQTRTYGSADPSFTFAYGAFVGTDTSAVIDTPPTCSVAGVHADVAGSPYAIACSGGLDNNYAFTYVDGTLAIGKATPTVNLTASLATFETKVPVTFTASLPAAGSGALPTGSVTFTITGFAGQAVALSAGAAASSAFSFTTTGARSAVASFAGDANYLGGQATIPFAVIANTVNATGVGLSSSSVYPIKDGWRDTVAVRGTRNEPISVAIRIYGPTGKLVRSVSYGRASGAYSFAWNGRTASGRLVAAGKYRVDQTLSDAYGASRLFRSYATVSLRTMIWHSATIYASRGPRHWQFSWGSAASVISGTSSTSSSALVLASARVPGTSVYDWIGVGYQFTLPSASTYRALTLQVMGRWSGSTAPRIGLNDWSARQPDGRGGVFDGRAWRGGAFNTVRPRTSVGTSATSWYSQKQTSTSHFVSSRTVRAFIDSGYTPGPFRYTVSRVRLIVSYGILR